MTLNKRDAALRAEATHAILSAGMRLDPGNLWRGAFGHTLYNHPKAALLSIKRAEAHLAKAKRALRAWAR